MLSRLTYELSELAIPRPRVLKSQKLILQNCLFFQEHTIGYFDTGELP